MSASLSPSAFLSVPADAYLLELHREKVRLDGHRQSVGFAQVDRLLQTEIRRVALLLNTDKPVDSLLPEPDGDVIRLTKKLKVPTDVYPDYNFVGRIVGPKGESIRQMEMSTGCKISLTGRGTKRNPADTEDLHVVITAEDAQNRAELKIQRAVERVQKIFTPDDRNDPEKLQQLLKLAKLNRGQFHPTYHHSRRIQD